jgi:ribosomal protein L11 methylase PrmA
MNREYSSFRDPSGVIFEEEGVIYRQINIIYKTHYDFLMNSGLYESLVKSHLLVRHTVIDWDGIGGDKYLVIRPERIPFISYPYEWPFDAYKNAALTVLRIQETALKYGMTLKDASAYNMQFLNGSPVLIDTLSFEIYQEGSPWEAYGQFCRHFLAPLLLMAHVDARLGRLMQNYIDGIPLDMADNILKQRGGFSAWQHITLHSRSIAKYENVDSGKKHKSNIKIKKSLQIAMVQSLFHTIAKLKFKSDKSEWGDYYKNNNYTENSSSHKEKLVKQYLDRIGPVSTTWDFGSNDGRFSRIALQNSGYVAAFDVDPVALNKNYVNVKRAKEKMIPLFMDITNPSPAIGFANRERGSIEQRQRPDVIIMLAIIHHLTISNNVPFEMIAQWLVSLCKYLIIEFVPKEDSQIKRMLTTREDIFKNYTINEFEAVFQLYFVLYDKQKIEDSDRVLYLFKSKPGCNLCTF